MRTAGSGRLSGGRARRLLAAALGGVVMSAGVAALTAPASAESDGSGDKTLTAAMDSSGVDSLNPFLALANGAYDTFALIYPFLTNLSNDGQPEPYLAESWEVSEDKLTWTFTIRDGLKWSDGEPITAEDAAWTLNLIMSNDVAATANGSLVSNFKKVSAPDATTLVIETKKPQSNMAHVSTTRRGIPIVPKHVWKKRVDNLKSQQNEQFPVVGYGPWELVDYKAERYERFTVNEDFELGDHGPPAFDKLVLKSFKNTDAAVSALRSGQISYLRGINPTQFESVSQNNALKSFRSVGDGWMGLAINDGAQTRTGKKIGTANPILGDDQVRLAIHHAIDKDKLVSKVVAGSGQVAQGYLVPAYEQWFWEASDSQKVEFDLDRANAILDEAGYDKKNSNGVRVDPETGKKLSFRLGTHSDSAPDAQIAKYLEGWLKQIGITVEIEPMSFSKLNDDLAKGDWDMLMDGWRQGPDPTFMLSLQTCAAQPNDNGTGGYTDSFHCNKQYDKLFRRQVTTLDQDTREQIVGEMQQILYEDNNNIMLYNADGLNAVRDDAVDNLVAGTQNSDGLYPPQKVFWNYLNATPPSESSDSGVSSTALYVGGGVAALLVVLGGGVALRRRATADERE